jgi:hypothetical protein
MVILISFHNNLQNIYFIANLKYIKVIYMSLSNNKFKSTSIFGNFNNLDYEDNSITADGYFQRNLLVDGNLNSNNILIKNIDIDGNIIYRSVATEFFVTQEINKLLGDQPSSFYDSLSEISNYIEQDINNEVALTNSIATKQPLLTNNSIIPKLKISEYFASNSIDNNILSLNNSNTNYGIKMLLNSNSGSINPNISNNDSLIYAVSDIVNAGALFLTTYSADRRSISYIRINVNTINIGSSESATSTVRITSTYLVNTCPNVSFTSLPTCSAVPSIDSQLINKSYVDTNFYNKTEANALFTTFDYSNNRYALASNSYFKFEVRNLIEASEANYTTTNNLNNNFYDKTEIDTINESFVKNNEAGQNMISLTISSTLTVNNIQCESAIVCSSMLNPELTMQIRAFDTTSLYSFINNSTTVPVASFLFAFDYFGNSDTFKIEKDNSYFYNNLNIAQDKDIIMDNNYKIKNDSFSHSLLIENNYYGDDVDENSDVVIRCRETMLIINDYGVKCFNSTTPYYETSLVNRLYCQNTFYTKTYIDTNIASLTFVNNRFSSLIVDLNRNFYDKNGINNILNNYVLSSNLGIYYYSKILTNSLFYNKTYINDTFYTKNNIDNNLNIVKYKQSPVGGQPSLELYPNIFIDTINGNAMRLYNNSSPSAGIFFNPNGSGLEYEINMNNEGYILLANTTIPTNGKALLTKNNSEIIMDSKINAFKNGVSDINGLFQFHQLPIFLGAINNSTVASNQFLCKSIADYYYTKQEDLNYSIMIQSQQDDIKYGGKYTTLPTFNNNDIGYTITTNTIIHTVVNANDTAAPLARLTHSQLTDGVYLVELATVFQSDTGIFLGIKLREFSSQYVNLTQNYTDTYVICNKDDSFKSFVRTTTVCHLADSTSIEIIALNKNNRNVNVLSVQLKATRIA